MPDVIQLVIQATDAASKVIGGVGDSLDKLDKSADSASKKLSIFGLTTDQIGSKMTQAGKIATVGLTLPIAGLAVAATKAASDLNETMNKVDVLFGDQANVIKKWSETSAVAFGQSKQHALDSAASFAMFGKSAGLAGNEVVKFAEKHTVLASDLASFNNTSPQEAFEAIGSALRGETEPIRRYNVLINEATLKDEALRLGIIKTTTEALTPQQKILATSALIFKQTSAAQGDYAKTADGVANATRTLNEQFQDTLASLGQALLPTVQKMVGTANELLASFNALNQPTKDLIVGFGLLAAATGPVLTIGGNLVKTFGTLSGGMISTGKIIIETAGYIRDAGVSVDSLKFAFQYLRAGGVVLGAELGVIGLGIVGITKFLDAAGKAANATNEELIDLARSGDLFKQAGASFEIIVNGQNRLNIAVQGVSKNLQEQKVSYDSYIKGVLGAAVAAGTLTQAQADEYVATGKVTDEFYHQIDVTKRVIDQTGILTKEQYGLNTTQNLVSLSAMNSAHSYGALSDSINRATIAAGRGADAMAAEAAKQEQAKDAAQRHTQVMREYAKQLLSNAEAYQRTKINIADTTALAITYTESQKKQSDVQKELDDLNAKIAARGPARVVTVAAEAKATTELTASQTALSSARTAADDIAKRDNESSAQYAMRLKDAQTNLKKLTDQMGSYIPTANAAGAADQKSALNQARLAAAQEDLATAQKKKGETDIEFALRVETIKGKIADYSKTLTEHTGVVGGATKAELEQKKALEEQIATLQKASEIDKAKGAFEALTASFRTGLLTEGQYQERVTALNAVTGLYTEAALKQATAQEILMKSFADPRSETWRGQLLLNQEAIDGQVNKTKELTGATDTAVESLKNIGIIKPVEIEIKTPKINIDNAKLAHDLAGDLKYAQPTITPKIDTTQATKDFDAFYTGKVGTIPAEKKTTFVADTTGATKNAQSILGLYGTTPPKKTTLFEVKADDALKMYDDLYIAQERLHDRIIDIIVRYSEEGEKPTTRGYQYGGSYIVPPNPRGGLGDYFPILAAPGERVTVQTKAQQNATPATVQSGDTFNYVTNVYNPLAAAMLADKQRRDRLARSNARMGVV